ncbi:asparagine synthase (glutamine-hydrolyzing) [Candidatus Pseudothioglobus singularis]|nr:asparagine synthase (glutamine-hydrolyzing) [Candidatus Pseudothioglobus singularis]
MCGIAGIFNSSQSLDSLQTIGHHMSKQMHHRGPDSSGVVVRSSSKGGNVLLAHTRLSIIDLSNHGAQPMQLRDGKNWITFNGEIYNYAELRSELIEAGLKFHSESDTEVILAAYKFWGLDCFKHFIGMWAIALWDQTSNKLILSRDRLGVKPLYFSRKGSTWYFGSEPKVILDQLPEFQKLDKQALSDYFGYRQALGGHSFFDGISKVESGTHIVISCNDHKVIRYWELDVVNSKIDLGLEEVNERVGSLVKSSVAYRMISDVPVGAFLSGGLDSSILVKKMSALTPNPIKTFTIGFSESGFNEFDYAQEMADYCSTEHTKVCLNAEEYINSLETMIRIKDAPLAVPNEIALHLLCKNLKKDASVVLSGEGADELFGGYGRIFRSAYDYERVQKYGQSGINNNLYDNLINKYSNLNWTDEIDHFLGQYTYMDYSAKQRLFAPDMIQSLDGDIYNRSYFENLWSQFGDIKLAEKYMSIFQIVHLEGLLGRLDSATMSASVEGRVPFVDHRLIEYVNSLPMHYKMCWRSKEDKAKAAFLNSDQISEKHDITKYILRQRFEKELPKRITDRRKVGFPVPLGKWVSGPLREYASDLLLNTDTRSRDLFRRETVENLLKPNNIDHGAGINIWMLLNIEQWLRIYNVSI